MIKQRQKRRTSCLYFAGASHGNRCAVYNETMRTKGAKVVYTLQMRQKIADVQHSMNLLHSLHSMKPLFKTVAWVVKKSKWSFATNHFQSYTQPSKMEFQKCVKSNGKVEFRTKFGKDKVAVLSKGGDYFYINLYDNRPKYKENKIFFWCGWAWRTSQDKRSYICTETRVWPGKLSYFIYILNKYC